MDSSHSSPAEQQAADAGPAPAAAAPATAADGPPSDAAAAGCAPEAKPPPEATEANPPNTSEELAAKEKNWIGIVERLTQYVAGAEERLQAQLAELAAPGWQPPPYACSGGGHPVPLGSAEGAALAWWQHTDRCLQVVMARGEDAKLIGGYQSKMRTVLARIRGELQEAAAAIAEGERQAGPCSEAPAGGAATEGGPAEGEASPAARPAITRSELAKRQWLMGGLAAAAARMDSLADRTAAMAAQAQEVHQAAQREAADKHAAYLRGALQAETTRRQAQEEWAARLSQPAPTFGYPRLVGAPGRPFAAPGGLLPGAGSAPWAATWLQGGPGQGAGQAPDRQLPAAGLFGPQLVLQAGAAGAMGRIGGQLDQLAEQLERQLGAQNRRAQEQAALLRLVQARGAALGAGAPRRPPAEERPPEWAPSQSQQAEVHLNKKARLRAMLELAEGEEAGSDAGEEAGSSEAAGEEGSEAGEEQDSEAAEEVGSEAAEEQGSEAGEEAGQEGAGAVARAGGNWSAELATEASVLSQLSYSFSSGSEADGSPGSSEQEGEEGQAAEDAGEEWALAPPQAAAEPQPALARPAAGHPPAEGAPAQPGPELLTAQQREYIAAQQRRFEQAKQAGEAAPSASPFPPAAPRPPSWQPRLPLAPRPVLPPAVVARREAGAQGQGPKAGGATAPFGLENR